MAPSLLHPPGDLSPAEAYNLYKKAPSALRDSPESISASPLLSLLSAPETPELWIKYENLLQLCLRAEDDVAAHRFLERLVKRFGDDNERMMAWKGLIKEATAKNNAELDAVLKEYDSILAAEPNNIVSVEAQRCFFASMPPSPCR